MADAIARIARAILGLVRSGAVYLAGKRGQEVRQHEASDERESEADEARRDVRDLSDDERRRRLRDWSGE